MSKRDIVVHVESPFFRDELIRLVHDLGGRFMDAEQIQHIPQMVDVINERILKDDVSGFSHVNLSIRHQEFADTHGQKPEHSVSNSYYVDDDHNEVVVTAPLLDWIIFSRKKNEISRTVKSWIALELKGLKINKIKHRRVEDGEDK